MVMASMIEDACNSHDRQMAAICVTFLLDLGLSVTDDGR